jgi:hypothetical protein
LGETGGILGTHIPLLDILIDFLPHFFKVIKGGNGKGTLADLD